MSNEPVAWMLIGTSHVETEFQPYHSGSEWEPLYTQGDTQLLLEALDTLIACRNLLEIEVNKAIARDAADAWIREKEAELRQHNNTITALRGRLETK